MKSYKLIGPRWTRAFRCIWMMEELGLSDRYELVSLVPASRELLGYNPSGKVPVLLEYENDNESQSSPSLVLAESVAINTYLGDTHRSDQGPHLVPPVGTHARALYDQTVAFILSELDAQSMWTYRKHTAFGKIFGYVPEIEEHCKRHFTRMNRLVAQQLRKTPGRYLLGDHFTAADLLYCQCLLWAQMCGWDDNFDENLKSYVKLCTTRPAFIRAKSVGKKPKAAKKRSSLESAQDTLISKL